MKNESPDLEQVNYYKFSFKKIRRTARVIQKHKEPSAFQSLPQHPDATHQTVCAAPIHP